MTFEQFCVGIVICIVVLFLSGITAALFNWVRDEPEGYVMVIMILSIILSSCITYIIYGLQLL